MTEGGGRVLTERRDHVLVMTLNRPDVRNAIDFATAKALEAALDALDADPELRVGVITGAGPAFCAGMDLRAFARGQRPVTAGRGFAGIVERPSEKPLVAAVEGAAVGGGLEIALACDLVVVAASARLGLPEVKRSLVPAGGGLLRLADRLPVAVAMELVLIGDPITGERAVELGLANVATPDGQALGRALELAERIAANGPLAVRAAKAVLGERCPARDPAAWARQEELIGALRASEDAREGAQAFLDKRAPVWRGR